MHQTININDGYMGSGKLIKRAIEKYGVGNINIERDIVHPKLIAQECFNNSNNDVIVGSGKLINVKSFYVNLLSYFKINYDDYVKEKFQTIDSSGKNGYFLDTNNIYQTLLEDTIYDVERFKNKISTRHN